MSLEDEIYDVRLILIPNLIINRPYLVRDLVTNLIINNVKWLFVFTNC